VKLVGREEELAQILAATSASSRRDLVSVVITGEAGIGKSVLLRAATDALEHQGFTVTRVGADALERTIPYAALTRVLTPLVDNQDEEVARQAADLVSTLDVLSGGAQIDASFGRVCGALSGLLRALCDRGPVVVAIDDLNVLDDDTLAAFAIVARRLRSAPIALLGTSRRAATVDASRFGTLVETLETEGALVRVALGAFDAPTIGLLIADVLASAPDDDLVHEMHRRTDGNPFFAVEIATSLRDEGHVDPGGQRGARLTAPMRLTRAEAVVRRFAPLDAAGRSVLDTIAVLGRATPSDTSLLAAVTGLDAGRVALAFDDLVARHVLAPTDSGFAFTHDLVRDAVYDAIGPARQRLLHAEVAKHLGVARAEGKPGDVLTLARHVSASAERGDAEAARVVAQAGDLVRDIAPVAAAAHYARALELFPDDDAARPGLMARHSRALALAARPADAVTFGRVALDRLPVGAERTRTANVVVGALLELGDVAGALAVADREATADPASPVLAAQRATMLWNVQRFDEALAEAVRADALTPSSPAERLLTLGPLGLLSAYAGIPRPLAEHTAEMLRLGATLPPTLELYSTAIASYALATCGFVALARAPLGRAEALMEEIGGTAFRAQIVVTRVIVDWLEGRWDEAMDAIDRAAADALDAELGLQAAGLQAVEIEIRSWRGETLPDRLLTADAPVPNFADLRAWARAGRLITEGKLDDARTLLSEAGGRNAFEIAYRPLLLSRRIEIEVASADPDVAAKLLDEIDRDSQRRHNPWAEVLFLRSAALVRQDAALAEQAADVALDEGLVFEQARCQLVAAELADDAAGGLDAAYRTFQALGADALRRRAAALLKACGLKVPRQRAAGDGPLSATEMKLARLVQQGMRNREIASVLHLSPRTVEVYLSRVYAKLNVASRLELARALDAGRDA
jgi:DNA-binding CsgD family transcriptional regulator